MRSSIFLHPCLRYKLHFLPPLFAHSSPLPKRNQKLLSHDVLALACKNEQTYLTHTNNGIPFPILLTQSGLIMGSWFFLGKLWNTVRVNVWVKSWNAFLKPGLEHSIKPNFIKATMSIKSSIRFFYVPNLDIKCVLLKAKSP